MTYLVDTDWIIDGLAKKQTSLSTLNQLSSTGLAVSVISLAELLEGAYLFPDPAHELKRYHQFVSGYTIIRVTEAIASRFAHLRALLRQQGNLIPDVDLFIAATALTHDLTLLTRNTKYFKRIADLRLYQHH
jgi:tRNA(fMet)-specific endonuclease VapC